MAWLEDTYLVPRKLQIGPIYAAFRPITYIECLRRTVLAGAWVHFLDPCGSGQRQGPGMRSALRRWSKQGAPRGRSAGGKGRGAIDWLKRSLQASVRRDRRGGRQCTLFTRNATAAIS